MKRQRHINQMRKRNQTWAQNGWARLLHYLHTYSEFLAEKVQINTRINRTRRKYAHSATSLNTSNGMQAVIGPFNWLLSQTGTNIPRQTWHCTQTGTNIPRQTWHCTQLYTYIHLDTEQHASYGKQWVQALHQFRRSRMPALHLQPC